MTKRNVLFTFFLLAATCLAAQNPADTMKMFTLRATYYSDIFIGRRTSSGELFKQENFTAAHKSLPLGTLLLVTNPESGSHVIVRVNDRCPRGGIIDLTKRASKAIGVGSRIVEVQVLPSRYERVWKDQNSLSKEIKNGTLLTLLNDTSYTRSRTHGTKTKTPGKDKSSAQNIAEERNKLLIADSDLTAIFTDTLSLYNIDLDLAANYHEAELLVDKLPMKYQNTAEILPSEKSSRVKITLDLSMPLEAAKEVQAELRNIFPDSKLRKLTKSEQNSF